MSCNSSSRDASVNNSNPYFPLSNNMTLNYKSLNSDKITNVKVLSSSERNLNDFTFSRFPFIWNLDSSIKVSVTNDGEILCKFFGEDLILLPSSDKMKTGYNWTSQEWNVYIESLSQMQIGNQTFDDVYKVNYNLSITYTSEIWFAKGIGIIKWGFNRVNPPTLNIEYHEMIFD